MAYCSNTQNMWQMLESVIRTGLHLYFAVGVDYGKANRGHRSFDGPGRKGKRRWKRSWQRLAVPSREEEGCIEYGFYRDRADPTRMLAFEIWANQDALNFHFETEHFKAAIGKLEGLLAEQTVDYAMRQNYLASAVDFFSARESPAWLIQEKGMRARVSRSPAKWTSLLRP